MWNVDENLRQRASMLLKAKEDKQAQALLTRKCREDIVFFVNNFLYTDRNQGFFGKGGIQPFVLFPYQEECVKEIWTSIQEGSKPFLDRQELTNVFIDKSRQMGISWVMCAIALYGFLFHDHKYLFISAKADMVDKQGDIKSLLEKIRFFIKYLPDWVVPFDKNAGFSKYMCIYNPTGTSSINGETSNPQAGTGGTYNAIFLDEMAKMMNASQINTACASATPCRIFNSTPLGKGNEFYRMRKLAEGQKIKWLQYHWKEHPFYSQEWYEKKKGEMSATQIAQELDISYDSSVEGRVYPEYNGAISTVEYNEDLPLFVAIDNSHGGHDPHAVIVCQPDGHTWNIIDYVEVNCSVTDMAHIMARDPRMQMSNQLLLFYNRYIKYKPGTFVADPYDTNSTLNQSTIWEEYQKVGIYLNTPANKRKEEQIMKLRSNIYRIRIGDNATDLANCLMQSRYPERPETSNSTSETKLPVHDQFSHGRSAMEYLATYLLENPIVPKPVFIEETINPLTGEKNYHER